MGPIISLSLPKSGTTTLAIALRRLGLRVADWRIRRDDTDDTALQDKLLAPLIYDGYFRTGNPLHHLGTFDALTEINAVNNKLSLWPQTDYGLLAAIEHHHPDVRFVLSRRAPADVASSIMRWNNLGKERLPRANVPGMPQGFGASEAELIQWIEGHYAFCDRIFQGQSNFLAYRPDDPQTPARIGAFLGLKLNWWGKANTTEDWLATQRQDG